MVSLAGTLVPGLISSNFGFLRLSTIIFENYKYIADTCELTESCSSEFDGLKLMNRASPTLSFNYHLGLHSAIFWGA